MPEEVEPGLLAPPPITVDETVNRVDRAERLLESVSEKVNSLTASTQTLADAMSVTHQLVTRTLESNERAIQALAIAAADQQQQINAVNRILERIVDSQAILAHVRGLGSDTV